MSLSRGVFALVGVGLLAFSSAARAQVLPYAPESGSPLILPVPLSGTPSVSASPASAAPQSPSGEEIVRTARQYLGVRYVLGGTTPRAFDCSGFVRYVYAEHGIDLPRTAREQAGYGDAPLPGDLRPGDLLFFYGGNGAQHIAMYAGGDTIIHASSSRRRVTLDRLSGTRAYPTWFGRRLIAIRRVLPDEREAEPAAPKRVAARPRWSTGAVMRPWLPRR